MRPGPRHAIDVLSSAAMASRPAARHRRAIAQVFFPNWSPTMNVRLVLSNVREVLKNPVVETPLEAELAELYANDRPKFDKLVKDHVKGLGKKKK